MNTEQELEKNGFSSLVNMLARSNRLQTGCFLRRRRFFRNVFPIPNPAKPEPKVFVRYSPVIPAEAGIQ
uniref:Uncharacterized protein n=1 Tax=Candidatus Kentrum sp. LPFa TaxID=2126335 RepID=A0A450W4G6_9GAMM|nr:MAG: hypothetical protein BECKLPF1236B_GA0070989_102719 [Candidatus Kentron sp. LPFa]